MTFNLWNCFCFFGLVHETYFIVFFLCVIATEFISLTTFNIAILIVDSTTVRVTDRQTDRQTDGQTDRTANDRLEQGAAGLSLYMQAIPCSRPRKIHPRHEDGLPRLPALSMCFPFPSSTQ